jgi:hypothetical protein
MNGPQLPDTTNVWASALQYEVDVLAGMLVATTQGKGRPFIDSQFCVLAGHLVGTPHIDLIIGDDIISLDAARRSKGTSHWFLDWRR